MWNCRALPLALGLALGVACGDGAGDDAALRDPGGQGGGAGNAVVFAGAGGVGGAGGDLDAAVALSHDGAVPNGKPDANAGSGGAGPVPDVDAGNPIPPGCPEPAVNQPPELLSCAGLYSDIAAKQVGNGVRMFAPATPLWSDGAVKTRWISLPPGTTIDVSNPDAWRFPVGTRLFKEFVWEGKRVETRLFWKRTENFWARTAYQWNAAESEATRSGGADIQVGGSAYHIPSTTECDQCHKGRMDRALGFEAISLGTAGAGGLDLATLKSEGLLSGDSLPATLQIGDDGTGHASAALAWLHINCGVSCHNGFAASEAYSTGLRLNIEVANADGRAPGGFESLTTTLGVNATTGRWLGEVRIVAGSPDNSLLYTLMSTRKPATMKDQMPPIASRIVPTAAAQLVRDWIGAM